MPHAPLTVAEVATRLAAITKRGYSRWTVLRLIRDGKLASTRLANGTHLIAADELDRYLAQRDATDYDYDGDAA